jgi:pilus assembly protein FimV
MQRLLTFATLVFALAMPASPALALGFGRVIGNATLGQPLSLAVGFRLDGNETVEPQCVKAVVISGDRRLPFDIVSTRIESGEAGERRVRVMTSEAIEEPILSFELSIGCPVRLSRQFTVFADPPYRFPEQASAEAPAISGGIEHQPPAARAVQGGFARSAAGNTTASARGEARRNRPSRGAATGDTAKSTLRPAGPSASAASARRALPPRMPVVAPTPTARGPVLKLDPLEEEALSIPTLRMATELSVLPAAAGASRPRFVDPEMEERARDKERMANLEASLKRLQDLERTRQQAATDMQAQLRDANSERYSNPLVFGLLAVCAALFLALLALLWLRRKDHRTDWWQPRGEESELSDNGPLTEPPLPQPPVLLDEAEAWPTVRLQRPDPKDEAEINAPLPAAVSAASVVVDPEVGSDARRPMSAEELIDLEQQAEFFVVLGQDEAAIDLLMGHLRSTGGVSPLPYLKLLEIYRRRDEQEPYERIRERFNQRFNAYAPDWAIDAEDGLTLQDYPEVLARLQAAWNSPAFAMELLDAALFRRDNGPGFEVPAYRDLLFLYGVARDLAERAIETDGVDLLLPLDARAEKPSGALVAELDPSADSPGPDRVDDLMSLELDVTLDDTADLSIQRSPSRGRRMSDEDLQEGGGSVTDGPPDTKGDERPE